MPRFLIAAAVQVEADSEMAAIDAVVSRVKLLEIPGFELLVSDHPKIELDPDSVVEPVLRTEQEMDAHPPFGDNLVTGDIEWLEAHEKYGIRVDLYDVHRLGNRNLPLFGFRLSHYNERENPRPATMQGQMGEQRPAREEGWEIIFTGEDYEPGPHHDKDMILADLLGFLSAFDELEDSKATPRQIKWLTHYRDELATWSAELEGEVGDDG